MACDEPWSNGDEKYRKGDRQDNNEKPANIVSRAIQAEGAGETFIFGKLEQPGLHIMESVW